MWIKAIWFDTIQNVWMLIEMDLVGVVWKRGTLCSGQVWAQLSDDAPYCPVTPITITPEVQAVLNFLHN